MGAFSGGARSIPTTRHPAEAKTRAIWRPMKPPAPVSNTISLMTAFELHPRREGTAAHKAAYSTSNDLCLPTTLFLEGYTIEENGTSLDPAIRQPSFASVSRLDAPQAPAVS